MRPDITLGFDTSAAHCAAALLLPDDAVLSRVEEMAKGQAERLMPMLEELLSEAGAGWRDITLLAVGTGPGNFTGVRIAVAGARGLALALGIPAVGVSALEALAFGQTATTLVAQDARRGMAYVQQFSPTGAPALVKAGDLPPGYCQRARQLVIGDLAGFYAEAHGLQSGTALYPLAEATARNAIARGQARHGRPAPLYLRPADAALPADPAPVILE